MKVAVTSMGDFWLDDAIADKLERLLNSTKTLCIRIGEDTIMSHQVKAVLSVKTYKDNAFLYKRSWKCEKGNVHLFSESCQCRPALPAQTSNLLEAPKPLTAEEQAQADLRANASREWIRHCGKDFKKLGRKTEREKFISEYIKKAQQNA